MGRNVYRKSLREGDYPEIIITFALQADLKKKKKFLLILSLPLSSSPLFDL